MNPVGGVKVNAPLDWTVRLPEANVGSGVTVAPAAFAVTSPPIEPPPNDVMAATGNPSESLSSRSSGSVVSRVSEPLASITYAPSATASGGWFTVSVKVCAGVEPTTLVAVKVIAYVPPVPALGVPESVPVPLPLLTKVTPAGSATPPRAIEGSGNPVAVTVKVPAMPVWNVTLLALVIAGAWFTVSVKLRGAPPFR